MDSSAFSQLIQDLLVILVAGFISGALCKKYGISLLVGYLVVGSVVGSGGLQLIGEGGHELELLAEAGALLLLFSVGIEFSREELIKLSRFFFVGGAAQLLLVSVPICLIARYFEFSWNAALLVGAAGALSSTVLVFRALSEIGQNSSPHGKGAIGILLFQDVALVPLLLLVPLLTGEGDAPTVQTYLWLAGKSLLFVLGVLLLKRLISSWLVPLIAELRSVELLVLFTVCLLAGVCFGAYKLGLPAAVGALAAGLALSGNRLTKQIDSILLPYRETFAAIFFVTLGMLLKPLTFFSEPFLLVSGLLGIIALKTLGTSISLRLVGLSWRGALGMGLGLAQLGEFSFLLVAEGARSGIIASDDYNRMLFIALGTLIMTPQLLRWGLMWSAEAEVVAAQHSDKTEVPDNPIESHALVIGIGPIGRQVASRLDLLGTEVLLLDLSPINLQPFAQLGFATFSGDARDPEVLKRARAEQSQLAVVCVPNDEIALEVVKSLRQVQRKLPIVVRCRFETNVGNLQKAGANHVVSEEREASGPLVRWCEQVLGGT